MRAEVIPPSALSRLSFRFQPSTSTARFSSSHSLHPQNFVLSDIDIATFKMARELTKGHKHKHRAVDQVDAQAQLKATKSSKSSKYHSHSSKITTQGPPKQTEKVQKPRKSKKTVSAAGVFKVKKSKHGEKKHRKPKARTPTPEPNLHSELRGIISIYCVDSTPNEAQMVSKELAPRSTRPSTPFSTLYTMTS